MSADTETAENTPEIDILSFDEWVKGTAEVRQSPKGYWAGIILFGRKSDLCKAAYKKDENGETNLVQQAYEAKWDEVKAGFERVTSNKDETTAIAEDGQLKTLADEIEEAVHFNTEIMMTAHSPFVNAMYTWMLNHKGKGNENPLNPTYYFDKDGKPLHQYGIRAKLLEGMGLDVLERSKELNLESPTCWGFNECEQNGTAVPKYQAKNALGEWADISAEDLEKMLMKKDAPHLVMTANHAFIEDEKADYLSITSGVEDLLQSATSPERTKVKEAEARIKEIKALKRSGEAFDTEEAENHTGYSNETIEIYGKDAQNENLNIKGIDENPGKGDTVMVSVLYSRENNVLNLAHLFRRLEKINHHKENAKEDDLVDISPASLMLASTILKTILQEDGSVRSVDSTTPNLLKAGANGQGRDETPKLLEGDHFTFRADAAEHLRHLACVGFSQGGNIMRDALRYAVHEIDRVQVKSVDGQQSTQEAARDILSALSVTAISLNEIKMNDFYTNYGANCGIVSNSRESKYRGGFIAPPPDHDHSTSDPVMNLDAFDGYHGHHPSEMLSSIVTKGGNALSHFQCTFAPNAGKVALRYVRPSDDGIIFEISGRTKQENIEPAFNALKAALEKAKLPSFELKKETRTDIGRRQYKLTAEGLNNPEERPDIIKKIRGALMETEKDALTLSHDVFAGLMTISEGKDVDKTIARQRIGSNNVSRRPSPEVTAKDLERTRLTLEAAGLWTGDDSTTPNAHGRS